MGGLLRAGAYFLPWMVADGIRTVYISGLQAGAPILSIGFSIAIVVAGVMYLAGRREANPHFLRSLGIGAVIASVISFVFLLGRIDSARPYLFAQGVTVSVGVGPWAQLAGALLAMAGGIKAANLAKAAAPKRVASPVPGRPDRARR